MKIEVPEQAETLLKASKMIDVPWFRALIELASQVNERTMVDVEEVSVSINIDEVGDDRGDVVTWSRVEGFTWTYGNVIEGSNVKRTTLREESSCPE